MKKLAALALSATCLATTTTGCAVSLRSGDTAQTPSPSAPTLRQVHDPGQVTGTLTGPCHTQDDGQLPDPNCTPGAYDPVMDAQTLCAVTYSTRLYRAPESQTEKFKFDVAEPAYGQHDVSGELDHLVPLELGGANDASNLWVEAGSIPNSKDKVETALHDWVCAAMPNATAANDRLQRARIAIAQNWMQAETALGIR